MMILYALSGSVLLAGTPLPRSRPHILYAAPYQTGSLYWEQTFSVMEKVAKNLNFEFSHMGFEEKNTAAMQDRLIRLLRSDQRPDAVILAVGTSMIPILEAAEANHVATIIQKTLTPEEAAAIGSVPRLKVKHWIATFEQDEIQKGYESGLALFETIARSKWYKSSPSIGVVALTGPTTWVGSNLRVQGMQNALKHFPRIELKDVAWTDWSAESAQRSIDKMQKANPSLRGIWAASDQLAIAAEESLSKKGFESGKDFYASGIDLSDVGLEHIIKGDLVSSSAMSMLGFAEMLIYIYDYTQGVDFASEAGVVISPRIYTATAVNAHQHLELYKRLDKINFRRFSKSYNRDLRRYNVSLASFLGDVGIHICSSASKSRELCYEKNRSIGDKAE